MLALVRASGTTTRWRWWQVTAWSAGLAAVAATVLGPLDRAGRDGDLVAHMAQHLLLGDVAPLLLVLGLPPRARRATVAALARIYAGPRRSARALDLALSPVGALVLWVLATYAWFLPPLHRAAVGGGAVHAFEHVSFVFFGLLLALAVFDPRPTTSPRVALRRGGLPWWGRHLYSMGSRVFMLPPAALVVFSSGYAAADRPPGAGRDPEQLNAASLLVGFEMVLFALSFVLAFLVLALSEGGRRAG